ncbi:hypothetical protein [Serratia marcescens]|uniref:hypothetical protein n=1 Tax=Serratia marcescens TaxID=615 RepID=UPI0027E43107|nr:hypothetical protein [Serratia marcescens]
MNEPAALYRHAYVHMFTYVLLMVPLLYIIDSRPSAIKQVRKATQNVIIIALTLLFFSAMSLLY